MTEHVWIVVVAGGPIGRLPGPGQLPAQPAAVIAADSGVDRALALDLAPTMVVGDMDSISAVGSAWVESAGIPVQRHDPAKDKTDLALAMDLAARGADSLLVIGSLEGRADHALATMASLASDDYSGVQVVGLLDDSRVTVVRRRAALVGAAGDLVSLIPMGGAVHGVTTEGLVWPLTDATLDAGTSLGISNEMAGPQAAVTISGGVLAAIQSHEPPASR